MIYTLIKDCGDYESSEVVTCTTSLRKAFKVCQKEDLKRYVEGKYGECLELQVFHNTKGLDTWTCIKPADLVDFDAFSDASERKPDA